MQRNVCLNHLKEKKRILTVLALDVVSQLIGLEGQHRTAADRSLAARRADKDDA